jgi:hypothetical protein
VPSGLYSGSTVSALGLLAGAVAEVGFTRSRTPAAHRRLTAAGMLAKRRYMLRCCGGHSGRLPCELSCADHVAVVSIRAVKLAVPRSVSIESTHSTHQPRPGCVPAWRRGRYRPGAAWCAAGHSRQSRSPCCAGTGGPSRLAAAPGYMGNLVDKARAAAVRHQKCARHNCGLRAHHRSYWPLFNAIRRFMSPAGFCFLS